MIKKDDVGAQPIHEPLAELERELIVSYVAETGHDLRTLLGRGDDQAKQILTDASRYATGRLTEVETRSHYLRSLRGEQ